MEKRALTRQCMQISVACSSLATGSTAAVFRGTMRNCCGAGACVELNRTMQEGSIVMIKATHWSPEEICPELPEGFRTLSLAEVKWSKRLEGERHLNYAVGFRYLPN
jgi:hypothetical protein